MKCNDIKNNLGAFLDEQPNALEQTNIKRKDIEQHLQQCSNCLNDLNQLKIAKQQIAELKGPQLSDEFDNNLAARIAEFEAQRPHCQTLNGHVASNVVAFKPRNNTEVNTQVNQSNEITKPSRSPLWAIAATVTFTAVGLTWLMLSVNTDTVDESQIAVEEVNEIIEIESFDTVYTDLESLPMLTAVDSQEEEIYWSDVAVEQFDQYTQLEDGYQRFNCGSPMGERGCALAADIEVSPLTVTKI